MEPEVITATVGDFVRLSGIGRSRAYEMIADGRLQSITLGRTRLIVLDSYRRLIEREREAQATAGPKPSPNPRARNFAPGGHPPPKAQRGRRRAVG